MVNNMSENATNYNVTNELAPPPAPAGPQIQRRESWADLPDEYPGFKVKVWVNAPSKFWQMLGSGDEAQAQAAAKQLVIAHNHWRDFDGNEYPPPSETAFWEEIPTELAGCIITAVQIEMGKLPNSMAPQRRRSKRG